MSKFQFRKRTKIAPGLNLNVSKKGFGLSAGPKGIKTSISAQGKVTGSVGIPGSGISYRKRLSSSNESSSNHEDLSESLQNRMQYIAIHGSVLSKSELRNFYVVTFLFIVSCIVSVIRFMTSNIGNGPSLLSLFLYFTMLILSIAMMVIQIKNKRRWNERTAKHLLVCDHLEPKTTDTDEK